jgi:hypothetical protein
MTSGNTCLIVASIRVNGGHPRQPPDKPFLNEAPTFCAAASLGQHGILPVLPSSILINRSPGTVAKQVKQNRVGAVKSRVQVKNPVTDRWVKIDTNTGRIIDHKKTPGPYKGVRKKH